MNWVNQETLSDIKAFLESKGYRFSLIDESAADSIHVEYPEWGWRFVPSTLNIFASNLAWRYAALTLWEKVFYDCLSHWLRTTPLYSMFDEQYKNMTAGEFREKVIGKEFESEICQTLNWIDELAKGLL